MFENFDRNDAMFVGLFTTIAAVILHDKSAMVRKLTRKPGYAAVGGAVIGAFAPSVYRWATEKKQATT